jgi:hypothetical protein
MEKHHFDTDSLAKSYLDLMRRGHVDASIVPLLERALGGESGELSELVDRIRAFLRAPPKPAVIEPRPLDYVSLAYEFRSRRQRRRQH